MSQSWYWGVLPVVTWRVWHHSATVELKATTDESAGQCRTAGHCRTAGCTQTAGWGLAALGLMAVANPQLSSQVDISRLTDEWRLKIMYQHLSFAMFRSFHDISRHSSELLIFSFSMFIASSNSDSNNKNNNFSRSTQQIKNRLNFSRTA